MTTPEEFVEAAAAAFEHTLRQAIAGAAPAAPDAIPSSARPNGGAVAGASAADAGAAEPSLGDPSDLGERAALLVVAQSSWRSHLGTLFDTAEVQALLGVGTRQAVSDRARRGGLLMLPTADGRRHYPAFQFGPTGQPFPVLPRLLAAFAEADVSPYTIASWFRTPQPLLGSDTPARWMGEGKPDEPLLEAARRTAARFAH
jgi:hypothetical protein